MMRRPRAYAIALICVGWAIAGATLVSAIVVSLAVQPRGIEQLLGIAGVPEAMSRAIAIILTAAAAAAIGFTVGTPLMAAGELILIALDQRRLLARQVRAMRKIERRLAPEREAPAAPKAREASLVNRLARR